MTKKQAKIIRQLVDKTFFLSALDYDFENNDETNFKENTGATFKQAKKAHEALLRLLNRIIEK